MNREAESAAKSLPERLRSITNEALWEYESDAIEAAADVLEEGYRTFADLQSMTAAFVQASQMLADAPHADDCTYLEEDVVEPYGTRISPNAHCNCWKAGL